MIDEVLRHPDKTDIIYKHFDPILQSFHICIWISYVADLATYLLELLIMLAILALFLK